MAFHLQLEDDYLILHGVPDEMRYRMDVQLQDNPPSVSFNRLHAQAQARRDLFVTLAVCE